MKYLIAIFLLFASPAFAQSGDIPTAPAKPIDLSIGIGGVRTVADLSAYIGVLYKFMVGAGLVIAAFMIAVGGFQYVMSAGIPKQVAAAKSRITNALIGLLLVLGSYVLLYSINPDFTTLKLPEIRKIEKKEISVGWCEDNGTYKDKFKCGDSYSKTEGAPVADGVVCIGRGQCGFGSCEKYRDPASNTDKYACVNTASCPSSCDVIPSLGTGDAWVSMCGSSACNLVIPGGCYVASTPSIIDSSVIQTCVPRKTVGQACSDTKPCQPTLFCNDETGLCENPAANLADGRACTLDTQCRNGFCDAINLDDQGRGSCLPASGLQLNGAICYKSQKDPNGSRMCGSGFVCVSTGNPPGTTGVCSDLSDGRACYKEAGFDCTNGANECVYDEGSGHGVCYPKAVSLARSVQPW